MVFGLGFVVRIIPEILSYPHPIGFDTVHYGWRISEGVVWSHWSEVFSSWLLYGLLIPFHSFLGVEPFGLLKLAVPLLFSFNVIGMYFFAVKALNWSVRRSLLSGSILAFQLASLRVSWDFFRNLLGLGVVLFALPFLLRMKSRFDFITLVFLSSLAAFSHEYAAVALLVVAFYVAVVCFRKKEGLRAAKVFFAVLPALGLFAGNLYLRAYPVARTVESNVIYVRDFVQPRPFGLFFLVDYLRVADPIHNYGSYFDLVGQVLTLFILLYLVTLPLVMAGFFRNHVLDVWLALLLVGSFGALVLPFFALDYWYRWMLMLVYPFTFYAANGISRILNADPKAVSVIVNRLGRIQLTKRTALTLGSAVVLLGSLFVTTSLFYGRFGVFSVPGVSTYFPSSMMANTVPVQDTADAVRVLSWLNSNVADGACVLVQEAFLSWARLYLDETHKVVTFTRDVGKAMAVVWEAGFNATYFIWWNESIGWYAIDAPNDFPVYSSGRISAYRYTQ